MRFTLSWEDLCLAVLQSGGFAPGFAGTPLALVADTEQHLAMLRILYGACAAALDSFRAAGNPVDEELVAKLETMVERTEGEIQRLSWSLARATGQVG